MGIFSLFMAELIYHVSEAVILGNANKNYEVILVTQAAELASVRSHTDT